MNLDIYHNEELKKEYLAIVKNRMLKEADGENPMLKEFNSYNTWEEIPHKNLAILLRVMHESGEKVYGTLRYHFMTYKDYSETLEEELNKVDMDLPCDSIPKEVVIEFICRIFYLLKEGCRYSERVKNEENS